MVPKRPLRERFRTWKRSLRDPLRGGKAAARWIASLPTADPLQLQHETLDLVASFPGGRRRIRPAQAEALVRVDARCEPSLSHWTAQYTANYPRSSTVDTRRSPGWFDLDK